MQLSKQTEEKTKLMGLLASCQEELAQTVNHAHHTRLGLRVYVTICHHVIRDNTVDDVIGEWCMLGESLDVRINECESLLSCNS